MNARNPNEDDAFHHLRSNIRRLRFGAGLTLKKAAERSEMHWRHWQKIEDGQINITLLTLARVAHVLRVDVDTLLRDPKRHLN